MNDTTPELPAWMNDWPLDGVSGHRYMMIIAKLAWILDSAQTGMYPEVESWQA